MADPDIRDDADGKRFVLTIDGAEAVVTYNLNGENLMITETLVPQALEGRGLAKRLAVHVLDDARARDLKVLPVCPFFAGYLQKHPNYADVVHLTYRGILGL